MNRRFASIALSLLVSALLPSLALAADPWPKAQTVRLVVPASAGGSLDTLARPLAQRLGEVIGQNVIVENRGGAGGVLGADLVVKALPDGYTFLMSAVHHAIAAAVYPKMPYDSARDLLAVAPIGTTPNMVVVNESVPAKTMKELVAYARANPAKLAYGTGGAGTMHHLSTEMFKSQAKIFMLPIHYKGSSPAVTDLLAGNVQVMFETLPSAATQVRAGKLRALAVTSAERSPLFPDVPTVAESGFPGYEASTWYGVMAPAKTPPEVVRAMNDAINTVLQREDIKAVWRKFGVEAKPMSAEAFETFWLAELKHWSSVAKANKISIE